MVTYLNDTGQEGYDSPILIKLPAEVEDQMQQLFDADLIESHTLSSAKPDFNSTYIMITPENTFVVMKIIPDEQDSRVKGRFITAGFEVLPLNKKGFSSSIKHGDSGSPVFKVIDDKNGNYDLKRTFAGPISAILRDGYKLSEDLNGNATQGIVSILSLSK